MKEDKNYKTFILNGEKKEEVVGLDTHSFEYFKVMCDCWSKEDLQYRAWEICVECIEKDKEIERLNKEKSILEKSLKLIWGKDIEIDYEELDNANKVLEEALKEGK